MLRRAVAAMLQSADPLLLPVLLRTRVLMAGLLNHLSTDPPGIITGVLGLLQGRVLAKGSRVTASAQHELWTDSPLEQLAIISAAAGGAAVVDDDATGAARSQHVSMQLEEAAEEAAPAVDDRSSSDSSSVGDESSDGEGSQHSRKCKLGQSAAAAAEDSAAAAAAAQLVADAAAAAYALLLELLTDPAHGLVAVAASQRAAPKLTSPAPAAHQHSSSSSVSAGERRALRLLQWLQPGHHPSHARLLQAVAEVQPHLAAELLQGLSYQLEPKPCGSWLGCVAVTGQLIAAAANTPSPVLEYVRQARAHLQAWVSASSSSSGSGLGSVSSWGSNGLMAPDAEGAAVKAAVRCCLPPVLTKVGSMQQCLSALRHL